VAVNTQIRSFTRSLVRTALAFGSVIFLIGGLSGIHGQSDENRCYPWQYRDDNGHRVDMPHVIHFQDEHHPAETGEQYWIQCMCEEETCPSGDDCGACSFLGTVCIRNQG
jgi:hypothetical protein